MASDLHHAKPPINEIGLSAVVQPSTLYDPYDVRGLHDAFRDEFSERERRPNIIELQVAPLVGGGSNGVDLSCGLPALWWFASSDETRVVQLQNDIWSYNWRRRNVAPGQAVDYPGYAQIVTEARRSLDRLFAWQSNNSHPASEPVGCELMYDNLISLTSDDGKIMGMSDSLAEFTSADPDVPRGNFSCQWMEKIQGLPDEDQSALVVSQQIVGMISQSGATVPLLRVMFNAGAARKSWDDVFEFYDVAHAHIRNRFLALITPKLQATWE